MVWLKITDLVATIPDADRLISCDKYPVLIGTNAGNVCRSP